MVATTGGSRRTGRRGRPAGWPLRIGVVLLVAVVTPAAGAPAAGAAPSSRPGAAPPPPPWCDASMSRTPCAFRLHGACYELRSRDLDAPTWGAIRCPASAPPPFMLSQRTCGRRPGQPVVQRRVPFSGAPRSCGAILTAWANVPHADRTCKEDADCTVVAGPCFHGVIAVRAARRYAPACAPPGGGACPDAAPVARCEAGCCIAEGGGFGTVEPAHVTFAPP